MASTQDVPARSGSMMSSSTSPSSPSSSSPPASSHPPVPFPAAPENAGEQKSGGLLVGLIVGGVVLATVLMVAFIWYRWNGVHEPTTAVIVQGDESLDGTVITVTATGPGMDPRPIRTSLSKAHGHTAPVLVVPGRYRVTAERNGMVLLRREVEVKRFLAVRFDLSGMARQLGVGGGGGGATTGPSAPAEGYPAPSPSPSGAGVGSP